MSAAIVAELRRRYPVACAWHGPYTGAWWALAQDRYGRHLLLEAPDLAELVRRLEMLGSRRPTPRPRTAPRRRVPPAPPTRVRRGRLRRLLDRWWA